MKEKTPRIVQIGGGTGSFVFASGARDTDGHISLVLAMIDDGGSNKILRDDLGLLPTSGVRQAMVALSESQPFLRDLFLYRFDKGGGNIEGMTAGNLVIAAATDISGSTREAIKDLSKLLNVKGDILPNSYEDARLVATYEDGEEVVGEHEIDVNQNGKKIVDVKIEPEISLDHEAEAAILAADLIVIGPGDLYTNTIANLVVKGMVEALERTKAKIVFVTNLMTSPSETNGYQLHDFFNDLAKYMPISLLDYVLINTNFDIPQEIMDLYTDDGQEIIKDDLDENNGLDPKTKVIRADLLSKKVHQPVAGDNLARSMIRHDPDKLATELLKLVHDD